jgi:hypothetical protein
MIQQRRLDLAMVEVSALGIHHDDIAEDDIHLRVLSKKTPDGGECSHQVLFVAIEIGEDIARGAVQPAIDGVVHAGILLNKSADTGIVWKPVESAVIRLGVLNNMFHLDALIGHRSHA